MWLILKTVYVLYKEILLLLSIGSQTHLIPQLPVPKSRFKSREDYKGACTVVLTKFDSTKADGDSPSVINWHVLIDTSPYCVNGFISIVKFDCHNFI